MDNKSSMVTDHRVRIYADIKLMDRATATCINFMNFDNPAYF